MKKYRSKVDTPWIRHSEEVEDDFITMHGVSFHPVHFAGLFEEVIEEDPVEKVAKWCHSIFAKANPTFYSQSFDQSLSQKEFRYLAQQLIAIGLDPSKLT